MGYFQSLALIAALFLTNAFAQSSLGRTPNMYHIVKQIADDYPDPLQLSKAENRSSEDWEFLDRVVQKLHSIDPRFGYRESWNLENPDDTSVSFSTIAYFTGVGDPWGAQDDLNFVDIIAPTHPKSVYWGLPEDVGHTINKWVFPRPGSPDYGYGSPLPKAPSEEGQCGPYRGESDASCLSGTFHSFRRDTDTEYIWVCRDIPYNDEDICRELKPPPVCLEGQDPPFWKAEGDECLPSCGTAQSTYCRNNDNDCAGWFPSRGQAECSDTQNYDIEELVSFETPCCLKKPLPTPPTPAPEPLPTEPPPSPPTPTPTPTAPATQQPTAVVAPPPTETSPRSSREEEIIAGIDKLTRAVETLREVDEDIFHILDTITRTLDELQSQASVPTVCPQNFREPDYRAVDGKCLPSCAEAQRIACDQANCRGFLPTRTHDMCTNELDYRIISTGQTYEEGPCCLVQRRTSP